MNALSIDFASVARLAEAPVALVLVVKWTALLALAWLLHALLARRNPRWRVALARDRAGHRPDRGAGGGAADRALPRRRGSAAGRRDRTPGRRGAAGAPEPLPRAVTFRLPEVPRVARPAPAPVVVTPGRLVDRSTVGRPIEPAPTAAWLSRAPGLVRAGLVPAWLAGVIVLTARLILAGLALRRLVRRAVDAPEPIVRECDAIAARLGCEGKVRVACSDEVAGPCLAGVFRPVLLLPVGEGKAHDDLPAILAHELAHARNRDLAWNLAAHVASIVLWFHPLAWRLRSVHAAACDAVSDAVAADHLGDVVSYARTLARLAVAAAAAPAAPTPVLAMARTSDVWRRLDALNRRVFGRPCRVGWCCRRSRWADWSWC